jgi:hypothetical protein
MQRFGAGLLPFPFFSDFQSELSLKKKKKGKVDRLKEDENDNLQI